MLPAASEEMSHAAPPIYPSDACDDYVLRHLHKLFPYKRSPHADTIAQWCSHDTEPDTSGIPKCDLEFWFKEAHLLLEMYEKDLSSINLLHAMLGLFHHYG